MSIHAINDKQKTARIKMENRNSRKNDEFRLILRRIEMVHPNSYTQI